MPSLDESRAISQIISTARATPADAFTTWVTISRYGTCATSRCAAGRLPGAMPAMVGTKAGYPGLRATAGLVTSRGASGGPHGRNSPAHPVSRRTYVRRGGRAAHLRRADAAGAGQPGHQL